MSIVGSVSVDFAYKPLVLLSLSVSIILLIEEKVSLHQHLIEAFKLR